MSEATRAERVKATRANVADVLRKFLIRRKLTVGEFNTQILKVSPRNVVAYNWLAGRGLPSEHYIPLLAKTLGRPRAFFMVPPEPVEAPAPKVTNGNGSGAPVGVPGAAAQTPEAAFDELFAPTPPASSGAPPSSVTHARQPRVILRERNALVPTATVSDVLDGPAKNSLTYWSNGDGTATVTMLFTAERVVAQRVFAVLCEHGVDATRKDEA